MYLISYIYVIVNIFCNTKMIVFPKICSSDHNSINGRSKHIALFIDSIALNAELFLSLNDIKEKYNIVCCFNSKKLLWFFLPTRVQRIY